MNLLKAIFGGDDKTPEEKKAAEAAHDFDVLKFDGVKAMRANQHDYAIQCFTHALGICEDMEVRDFLSQSFIATGNLAGAKEQLDVIAEAHPDNLNVFLRMAHVSYMMEDYSAMGDAADKAMAVDAQSTTAMCMSARAHKGQGDMVSAVAVLTKALAVDAECADACLLRGELLLQMGDKDGAEADADTLLRLAPDNEDVCLLKARVAAAQGRTDEAIEWYGKVADANPFCVAAYRERGKLRYDRGETREAADDMQRVLELEPEKASDVNGEFSAEGIEDKLNRQYKAMNPYGF